MTDQPTDFDILARNAAAMNAEEDERRIEPHWSDDRAFESEAQWKAFHAGEIPYPGRRLGPARAATDGCYSGHPSYDRPTGYDSWKRNG